MTLSTNRFIVGWLVLAFVLLSIGRAAGQDEKARARVSSRQSGLAGAMTPAAWVGRWESTVPGAEIFDVKIQGDTLIMEILSEGAFMLGSLEKGDIYFRGTVRGDTAEGRAKSLLRMRYMTPMCRGNENGVPARATLDAEKGILRLDVAEESADSKWIGGTFNCTIFTTGQHYNWSYRRLSE